MNATVDTDKWTRASKAQPCCNCGKDHGCLNAPDLGAAACWHNGNGGKVIQLPKDRSAMRPAAKIVATYSYHDDEGTLLYQSLRWEPGRDGKRKSFQQRRFNNDDGTFSYKMAGVRLVPYRLPELLNSRDDRPGEWRLIVEGEKDSDNLSNVGLIATCNVGGAGKWRPEYSEHLAGERVCIVADKDKPGRDHAEQVAQSLHGKASIIKVIELPGNHVKDASDFLSAGGSAPQILELAEAATTWQPGTHDSQTDDGGDALPDPIPLSDPPPPAMPDDVLIGWLGDMAREVTNAIEAPSAFVTLHALGAVATAAHGRFSVNPEPGYFEPVNLFIAAALESGSRKSAVQRAFLDPFIFYEKARAAEHVNEVKRLTTRKQVIESQLKAAKEKAAKLSGNEFEAAMQAVNDLEDTIPEIPIMPRVFTGDCTTEHTATMLSQQDERLAIWNDEGGPFDTLAGRYSNGVPNYDLHLQAYSGSPVRVDRGSRASVLLNHPALTIVISPQPEVLSGLASKPGFRGRGLLARFLYIMPRSNLGYRSLQPCPIRDSVSNTYRTYIVQLLTIALRNREPSND